MIPYEHLWRNRSGWYNSRQFNLKELQDMFQNYKYFQVSMRYNKFKEKDDNRGHFVFHLNPTNEKYGDPTYIPFSDALHYSDLKEALEDIRQKAVRIQDGLGNIDSNYHAASAIESITDELLSKLNGDE